MSPHRRKHDELEDRPSRSSKDKYRERSPLEVAEKAPPSEMIGGPHTGPSKMDKYFTQDYDPRLDVSLDTLTDPSTGLIGEGNFDEWSAMLDILKIRRQEKNYLAAERAERDRDAKYSSSKKTSSTKIPATTYDEANKAILTMGGYAKTKKGTEWGKGPDLSF